jgi:hypothetical protein
LNLPPRQGDGEDDPQTCGRGGDRRGRDEGTGHGPVGFVIEHMVPQVYAIPAVTLGGYRQVEQRTDMTEFADGG